jgi:hypothetical protein
LAQLGNRFGGDSADGGAVLPKPGKDSAESLTGAKEDP